MATRRAKCPRCGHLVEFDPATTQQIVCPNCQATLTPPKSAPRAQRADPLVGQSLGEFEILELLGRGGMGAVYKARQPSLDRVVALKVLRSAGVDPTFVQRFGREARAAAAVSHPNIIEIYAVGEDGGHQYLAMELVGGEHLGKLLRRGGPLPAERALALMKQVAAALAKAHAAGILHRDIKPSNILTTADGLVKVADFGLAKRVEGDVSVTTAGRTVGTVLYMAPEVAAGKPADIRSDLYSLGATFYHVLTGHPPFQGSGTTEVALKHAQAPVPPLAERAPRVPAVLCRLIHRLLRKSPGERYQSAEGVLTALDRVERRLAAPQDDASSAEMEPLRPSFAERLEAKRQQRRRLLLTGGIGGAAAVLFLALVLILSGGGEEPAQPDRERAVGPRSTWPPTPGERKPTPPPSPPSVPKGEVTPKPPMWAAALKSTEAEAGALVTEQRFGDAVDACNELANRYDDVSLRQALQEKIDEIRRQGAAAYREIERRATALAEEKKFTEARDVVRAATERYGLPAEEERAKELLARIEAAMRAEADAAKARAAAKAEDVAAKADEEEARRRAEARYAQALQPIEAMIKAWDYRKAAQALAQLNFEDHRLADRLARRRADVALLAKLKTKMVAKINNADPRLSKRTLLIPGINGDLVKADEKRITAKLPNGALEGCPWRTLSGRSARLLVQLVANRKDPDDRVASGLLALAYDDVAAAEKEFEAARALGAAVDRYLTPIVEAALVRATGLIDRRRFGEAEKALAAIETKYGEMPWYAARKEAIEAARRTIKGEVSEAAAEKLYKQALKLYKHQEYFDLKPLVDKLVEEFADTRVVTDAERQPSVAQMLQATEQLGKIITVRQDGKGDFKSIQAAIDAAPPNSIIAIADSRAYSERLLIPEQKKGLTLKGKKGCWPILGSQPGGKRVFRRLLDVEAPDVTVERIIFALSNVPKATSHGCIEVKGMNNFRLRSALLYTGGRYGSYLIENYAGLTEIDHCVLAKAGSIRGRFNATNTVSLGKYLYVYSYYSSTRVTLRVDGSKQRQPVKGCRLVNCAIYRFETSAPCQIECCTFPGGLEVRGGPNVITNSIISQIDADKPNTQIDYCNVFGKPPFVEFAKPGRHCISRNPLLFNLKGFDYRLRRASPCRRKASDGGDLGCRYTKEMRAMLQLAEQLRRRGIIQFAPISDRDDY